ncbi:hypothetical protein BDW42DRAFT_202481 [Aspergillus taichungensis]|uniref:Uncharacterized protein n=1 Tax=Aspergillus taichungensis TaxID=482145 RepID=A0A2J5HKY3_9EURO|nr:hypothetical protein BDW42DRAFT_202481 [Aspergillus taichungensis]
MDHPGTGQQLDRPQEMLLENPRRLRNELELKYDSLVDCYENQLTQKDKGLQEAESRIRYLEKELSGSHIKLPNYVSDYQISDAKIQEGLRILRDNISNWVESFPDTLIFEELFVRKISKEVLLKLMPGWTHSFPNGPDDAQMELMTSVIFKLTWNCLFKGSILGNQTHQELLSHIQEGMSYLSPRIDLESMNAWKADTIRAYMAHPRYREVAETRYRNLKGSIYRFLGDFYRFDESHWEHKLERFMMQIASPAAELAARMASSPSQYGWLMCFPVHKQFPEQVVRKNHLKRFTIIDAESHNKIQFSDLESFNDSDMIGVFLALVFPGLSRCGEEGHSNVLIEKPVILIATLTTPPSAPPENET